MNIVDIFNNDAFSIVSLTDAINSLPFKPGRIGKMGLFAPRHIETTAAAASLTLVCITVAPKTPTYTAPFAK